VKVEGADHLKRIIRVALGSVTPDEVNQLSQELEYWMGMSKATTRARN